MDLTPLLLFLSEQARGGRLSAEEKGAIKERALSNSQVLHRVIIGFAVCAPASIRLRPTYTHTHTHTHTHDTHLTRTLTVEHHILG